VFFQFTTTRDTFLPDESIPEGREHFGLLSQDVNAWAVGADYSLSETVHFGLTYGWDKYATTQKSRNANPPPDPTWTDPSRNWFLDNTEKVNTVTAYVDMLGLMQSKADLRVGYEMNDSDNNFDYYGPRPVHSAAQRRQRLAPFHGRLQVLREPGGRRGYWILVRELRRHRLEHPGLRPC
jgi:hypothetical protein